MCRDNAMTTSTNTGQDAGATELMPFVFSAGSMVGGTASLEQPQSPQRQRRGDLWHQRHAASLLSAGVPTMLLDE